MTLLVLMAASQDGSKRTAVEYNEYNTKNMDEMMRLTSSKLKMCVAIPLGLPHSPIAGLLTDGQHCTDFLYNSCKLGHRSCNVRSHIPEIRVCVTRYACVARGGGLITIPIRITILVVIVLVTIDRQHG